MVEALPLSSNNQLDALVFGNPLGISTVISIPLETVEREQKQIIHGLRAM
jgi:hypothetical protein